MHYKEQKIINLAKKHNGHYFSKFADETGVERRYIQNCIQQGWLIKVAYGTYLVPGYTADWFYILDYFRKRNIFDLQAALYLHHYIDIPPNKISVVFPRGTNPKNIDTSRYTVLTRTLPMYKIGKTTKISDSGHKVSCYNLSSTLIHMMLHPSTRNLNSTREYVLRYINENGIDELLDNSAYMRKSKQIKAYLKQLAVL